MSPPRVKFDGAVPPAQSRKERAQVLENLFKHVRDEAAALLELSDVKNKSQLRTELATHAHLLQKTLDTIQRGCP
ncbi:MAG: hypothetical protein EPN91_08155 [Salinibacterium sp.]|nr:MAG: hypothetical protein EPN91_08155 [Salinibacterium sp.]